MNEATSCIYRKLSYNRRAYMDRNSGENIIINFLNHAAKITKPFFIDSYSKKWLLIEPKYDELIKQLTSLDLQSWHKKYINLEILDGEEWTIELTLQNNKKIKIFGINAYPPKWEQFQTFLKWIDICCLKI